MAETVAVILAAGRGTRMHSGVAKALHELGGVPMAEHVVRAVRAAGLGKPWLVVGYQADRVEETLEGLAQFVVQPEMHGTGDALAQALAAMDTNVDEVVVLVADSPLVPPSLITQVLEAHHHSGASATIVTTIVSDPAGYGRIIRGEDDSVRAIVEDKDAMNNPSFYQINEINTGLGVWSVRGLAKILSTLPWHDEERYLTDAVARLIASGQRVEAYVAPDPVRVMGINTRRDLAHAEAYLRELTLNRLFDQGVTIVDPASTFVDVDVEVGQDSIIYPMTFLRGKTRIGRECHLGPMTSIISSRLGDGVKVDRSVVEQSALASHSSVGPFSHLRPGTSLDHNVKIGNFVELKNTRVGTGTKAGHHSYMGDATIGGGVNIGAGTVIVNFDGKAKHPTFIGDGAFIGCNVNLVAPVEVGPGAYVAAGSTITQNVPPDALAIARSRQDNKPEWARQRRKT
ncbi:MAG: bifunctional UDP-N-acetylglucosamine diphosphorylase/glucosamine-1-phosphate N-acetyltransferase GlmU [Firmicutes bacterium]|uniref:Bifunctional protein GlmU n=1 Tax=Sulfobacillus benefaciens TaxID=453960 RepID=A0A2T2X8N3_9FIRM|nr:bifunctional UDP-N-acetylglucosamine diphosphorylase/glucosamine-1-phosphate N-acetyltransferase GlmU [Bacillota bacterium]MCL5014271.1 bifunctional UDP-N-acetylglucosamine diphosphorylase/glucosamine-1-phosphate N-acetyltransferase GlmU [Bacillota bacterium]PSR30871.1 MAG: UDP-N-acetylglucosamine diphosphorylase/glucosamine-1-phosphate N-acetyltransferase [Sulfobacillus benefaciens]